MKEPVFIDVRTLVDHPGLSTTSLQVRMYRKGALNNPTVFDKWAGIADKDNKASRLQLLDSILRMVEEASQ